MAHRPDPPDLNPLKFVLLGTTNDVESFTTGFWTRDYSAGSPPDVTAATAFVTALKGNIANNTNFVGWGWRLKSGTIFTTGFFAAPIPGTYAPADGLPSNSATLSYGGVAVDVTGTYRNIRTMSHVPRGLFRATEAGVRFYSRSTATVATFLDWFATQHPTDNFGRPLNIYPKMNLQSNAFYQERSGF